MPVVDVVGMERDRAQELAYATGASKAWGADGGALWAFADRRALPGPVRTEGRDFCLEAMEECADGCNYICWLLIFIGTHCPNDPYACDAIPALMRALGALAVAYDALLTARHYMSLARS